MEPLISTNEALIRGRPIYREFGCWSGRGNTSNVYLGGMHDELFKQEGYDFMAAAFEVYNEKGNGFLEDIYHESIELELTLRNIPWASKPPLQIYYKGRALTKKYYPDMLAYGELVIELKAARALTPEHVAQLLHYLKASRKRVGYLVNFGAHPRLEWKRFVIDHPH